MDSKPYSRFKLKDLGIFEVFGLGEHIVTDAALAILASLELGENLEDIRMRLREYKGIKKRFDIIQNFEECVVIDDYGHHPTEIKATINALQKFKELRGLQKITAIWQPHKYSRTLDNIDGFIECFSGVDALVILPIWSAGELHVDIDLKGALSKHDPIMAERINKEDGRVKIYNDNHIINEFSEGIIVAFGAGDITYQIRGELH